MLDKEAIEKTEKAGKITKDAVAYAKSIAKKGMSLLELAEKIEGKIVELGGRPAFPVNLSINEIAAHATPSYDGKEHAHGLLKIDIGVHIDGYIADTAFSVDLENKEENKNLIEAAESGLREGLKAMKIGARIGEIGAAVEREVKKKEFNVIKNLTGHSIERYGVHGGEIIVNYDNGSNEKITEGVYAIEPFSTNGFGKVKEGKASGIYEIVAQGNVRDNFSRDVLNFIVDEYQTMPFCSRWIVKKFGTRGLLALKFIAQAGILREFEQLVESAGGIVAQAEHTVIVEKETRVIT